MIYYTGDIHGNPREIVQFCDRHKLTEQDTLVLLGDVGANYFLNGRDAEMKQLLTQVKPTLLCIHGNHEVRPSTLPSYQTKEWNGGTVWVEETYPRLLFAADGEIFHLEGLCHLVIGGAYSVDKFYRLDRGYGWWPDEQPSDETKRQVEALLARRGWQMPVVLTHTCPLRYKPLEALKPDLDQSTVDCTTELWMDAIESRLRYDHWFCGHFHTDKQIDNLHILFQTFVPFPSEG